MVVSVVLLAGGGGSSVDLASVAREVDDMERIRDRFSGLSSTRWMDRGQP
jgi:hypothetical protein